MQLHDYSQLPVMKNDREVSGVVTWDSIGRRLALGRECPHVRGPVGQTFENAVNVEWSAQEAP